MPDPAGPGIRELAVLLRAAGLDPSAEEIADALWLAGRIRRPGERPVADPADPAGRGAGARDPYRPPVEPVPGEADGEERITLHPPGTRRSAGGPEGAEAGEPEEHREPGGPSGAGAPVAPRSEPGVPVRVPGAAALPRILDIQRALRALQRHRPPAPPTRRVLDEQATAEASARALGLVIPVLRPESRREATVRLVMDASPSMAVWQEMFEELRSVCERLGAFRDVQVHYLHRLGDGSAALGRGPAPGAAMRSGEQLRDPTGRALTMVVSDCAGPVWREGTAQRLLHRWAECTPCVVVQPLPQRLWGRSWLPTERGTLARVEGGGRRLGFRPERPPLPGRPAHGLTVPVLPPSASALGAWARLVAGLGSGPVPAEVARVLPGHPAAAAPPPRAARPPRELVARFRSSAAPRAVQLAVYLSAAPLTLPVMRLVQRTMLPDSEPSDLAEVLLSGLLRRSPGPGQWYEFVPGVRDVLLGPLGRDEAALVLKHCSEYVLAHFGRGVRNFPALAVSQLTGLPVDGGAGPVGAGGSGAGSPGARSSGAGSPGPGSSGAGSSGGAAAGAGVAAGQLPQAFAEVSAKVVRRYLPGMPEEDPPPPPLVRPAGRARAVLAARTRLADGDPRALYEAVAVLRRAVAAPAGPGDPPEEAETELAGALLRLWAAQRDPELLAEAERAVTGLRTPPARAVRGRALYERALAAAPDAELLDAADREFAAAGAATADPELRRDCAVWRAGTLIRLSGLRADPAALHEARAALEPLAGPADGLPGPVAELQPALGRVLLALLPYTPDPSERAALAEEAAARLTAALAALPEPAGQEERAGAARVRVDLAGALLYLPSRLGEAAGQLDTAVEESEGDPELRPAALVCLARVHRARYERDADPVALEDAAEAYGRARRLIPRDAEVFGELLPEWGDVLLERARAADGRRFTGAAVRVLRDARAAVPQSDPDSAHRLRRLATGLRLRHGYEGDPVDLREAEHLLELAVRQGRSALDRARAWRDHGDVQQEIHAHTRAADRLDRAADSYRRAWRAALEADREERPAAGAAVRLAARVQELRGEVLERLARPRAALDAYRSALELWARLDLAAAGAAERAEAVRGRVRALEAGP